MTLRDPADGRYWTFDLHIKNPEGRLGIVRFSTPPESDHAEMFQLAVGVSHYDSNAQELFNGNDFENLELAEATLRRLLAIPEEGQK